MISVLTAWRVPQAKALGQVAHVFVLLWIILGLRYLLILGGTESLHAASLLGAIAVFYLLAVLLLNHRLAVPLALGSALWAMVHLFAWFDFALAYKMLACAGLGALFTALGYALGRRETETGRVGKILVGVGQVVFFISLLATALLALQRLAASHPVDHEVWTIFYALLVEAGLALLFFVRLPLKDPARNLYLVFAVGHIAVAVVLLAGVALGLFLTAMGFIAWAKEESGDRRQSSLSPMLLWGCLLAGVPLALTVLQHRAAGQFLIGDEAAMFVIGLLLLAAGCVCQLRIPTIAGAALTLLYLFGLLLFVPWGHLGSAALIVAGGGATIFLLGLALSIFRDRLLALPVRMRERKGVFQVLGWR
jgi:hypothetical protein